MAQDIGLLLRGLGAAFSNTVPQFRDQMLQEEENAYIRSGREREAQMQRAEMTQARQRAMYQDAESALKLLAAGDLDSVISLGRERIELLKNFPDADPSDTVRITQLAQLSRAGDRNAYQSLQRELLGAVNRGMAMGYITPPQVEEKVYRPGDVVFRGGQQAFSIPEQQKAAEVPAALQTLQARAQAAGLREGTPEYQEFFRTGGSSGGVNINLGDSGSTELNKLVDQQAAAYLSAGSSGASLANDLNLLSQLAPLTTEGTIPAAITRIYPEFNDANSAFQGIVSQALPKLRVPGSGAQSDRDIDILIQGIGPLAASNEAKQLLIQAMIQKNDIDQKRAEIAQRYATQEIDRAQYLREIRSVDSQTIISEPLRGALGRVMGIPKAASDAGITIEEWNAMTPQGRATFNR
jgi:hypothetical protein